MTHHEARELHNLHADERIRYLTRKRAEAKLVKALEARAIEAEDAGCRFQALIPDPGQEDPDFPGCFW